MSPRALLRLLPVLVLLVVGARPVAAQVPSSAPFATPDEAAAYMFPYLNQYWFAQFFGSDDGLDYDLLVEYYLYDSQFDWAAVYRCPIPIPNDTALYCAPEQAIFIDRQLIDRYSADFGPWVTAYAMAHEWGHHIQWTITNELWMASFTNAELYKFMELQADCFAGAALRPLYDGGDLLPQDVAALYGFANVLGDDRGSGASPRPIAQLGDHGVGSERVAWFEHGLTAGTFSACMP